ncbi:hypothetical protein GGC64_006485 [Mycobacterium sp. OAS707]|nr:hypothetical protein [Mycobacterium sp. OAS707]
MNAAQKIVAFMVGLAVVFTVAVFLGRAVGPEGGVVVQQATGHDDGHGDHGAATELPGGLSSMQDGYTLSLAEDRYEAASRVPLRFRILDASGAPVMRYIENHEKLLHLIVVRNDLTRYQHVHPRLGPMEHGMYQSISALAATIACSPISPRPVAPR